MRPAVILVTILLIGASAVTLTDRSNAEQPAGTTLTFASTESDKLVDVAPPRGLSRGDYEVIAQRWADASTGQRRGTNQGACHVTSPGHIICFTVATLHSGTLTASARSANRAGTRFDIAVVGGTGAYQGARGSGTYVESNKNQRKARITIHLLP